MKQDEYEMPNRCERCGSENLTIRFLYDEDKCIARYVCSDCNYSRSIPKVSNLKRRTNSTLTNWAAQIVKLHPFCAICGSKEDLEAHHIIPVSNSRRFMYQYTNGITLCKKCHYLVHNREDNK